MSLFAASFCSFGLLKRRFALSASKVCLVLGFLVLSAGCTTYEKQAAQSPLAGPERRLHKAEREHQHTEDQAAEYLAVAKIAAGQLAKRSSTNAPQDSGQAISLYDRAAADLATDLPSLIGQQYNSTTLTLRDRETGETFQLRIGSPQPGALAPTYFDQILAARTIDKKGLQEDVARSGLGGPVIGVHHSAPAGSPPPRLEPPKGFRVPMTAVVDFGETNRSSSATIRLLNPNKIENVELYHEHYPLSNDFTAALASYGRVNENWVGLMNMIRGEHMRTAAGLLMASPYDPQRVPVIFVHGLLSSPYIWRNVVNSLAADPKIRQHYQFWAFSYSTGNPIAYSALLLRDDLAYAREKYGFGRVSLIGHSMGGILSRLQVTNSRKVIWNDVFGAKADQLDARLPADSIIKRALIVQANPAVKRIIFVATPHRGSALASGGIGALGARLIRLPFKLVSAVPHTVFAALAPNSDPRKVRPPTSISGLSPKNPLLLAMDKLPIEAPHNSIIGDRGRGDTPNSSDGVVPYWSSHLASAQSELIVPTDHGAMKSPKAVAEIHRILLLDMTK
jgi:pimeloyl-ACP methyl ester carboxylesterase